MSLLKSDFSLTSLLTHEFIFDWFMIPEYIISLIGTSKTILDIVICHLFCQYIYNPDSKFTQILKTFLIKFPKLLNIENCNNIVRFYTSNNVSVDFCTIYGILCLDIFINRHFKGCILWSAFKKNVDILFYLNNKKNNDMLKNEIIDNIEQLGMVQNIFKITDTCVCEAKYMDSINRAYYAAFDLKYLKSLSLFELIIYAHIINHNDCWIAMVINSIYELSFDDFHLHNENIIMPRFRAFNNGVVFNRWKIILSGSNKNIINYIINNTSVDNINYWIDAHANIFYLNILKFAKICHAHQYEFCRYITQSAMLLKMLISKFENTNDAYDYIATYILPKHKNIAVSLFLLEIDNKDFKLKVFKLMITFLDDQYVNNCLDKLWDLVDIGENDRLFKRSLFLWIDDIKIIFHNIFIYTYNRDTDEISAYMQNKNIQKIFYENELFHKYFSTTFYHLLPENYKFNFTNNKYLWEFRKMIKSNNHVDISKYLLLVWKSIQTNKATVRYCGKLIFSWLIESNNLNMLNKDNLFYDHAKNLITAALDYKTKTNYIYIKEQMANYLYISHIVSFLEQNEEIKLLFVTNSKLTYQTIYLLFVDIIRTHNIINTIQLKINFLKFFKIDLKPMFQNFSETKKNALADLIL